MGAMDACLEPEAGSTVYDFYDGLAALLRICDAVDTRSPPFLISWMPRVQGYLGVALKHLPAIGGVDYAQPGWARQWRAADLLDCAAPISARWLQQQLAKECARLAAHAGIHFLREALPAETSVVLALARRRAGRTGLFWD